MAKPKTSPPPETPAASEADASAASVAAPESAAAAVPVAALERQIETGTPVPIDDAGIALSGDTSAKPPLGAAPTVPDAPMMIAILSKAPAGFRRGGRAHQPGVTLHPLSDFTAEQLGQIEDDPLFLVHVGADLPPASVEAA